MLIYDEDIGWVVDTDEVSDSEEVTVTFAKPDSFTVFVPRLNRWLKSDPDNEEPILAKSFDSAFIFKDAAHAVRGKYAVETGLNVDATIQGELRES